MHRSARPIGHGRPSPVLLRGVLLGLLGVLLLSGCTASPSRVASTPSAEVTPHWTDPPNLPGEITRSILDRSNFTAQVDGPVAPGPLAVEGACTGSDGSALPYELMGAGGTVFGPDGTIPCNAGADRIEFTGTGVPSGELVQVVLRPGDDVKTGYVVLLRPDP